MFQRRARRNRSDPSMGNVMLLVEDLPRSRSRSVSPRGCTSTEREQDEYQPDWINEGSPLYRTKSQCRAADSLENSSDSNSDNNPNIILLIAGKEQQQQQAPNNKEEDEEIINDVSSTSSSSSCSTNEEIYDLTPDGPDDMKFSLTSNLLFLAGACIQTFVSCWEVRDEMIDAKWDAAHENTMAPSGGWDDDEESSDDTDSVSYVIYYTLNSIGPFLYILNALVDAQWALTLPPDHPVVVATNNGSSGCYILQQACKSNTNGQQILEEEEQDDEIRKDVNSKLWDFLVAVIFGLGATLELVCTLLEGAGDEARAMNVNVVAMHTYLVSGLLHLQKDRRLIINPGGSLARILMGSGTIMFLMGSILDCIMSYLYDPQLISETPMVVITPLTLAWCNLASTILWNVNAIFFVWADCLIFGVAARCRYALRRVWLNVQQQIIQQPTTSGGATTSISGSRESARGLSLPLLNVVDVATNSSAANASASSPKVEHTH